MEAGQRILFVDEELHRSSFGEFERMRRDCQFCDITVNFGDFLISAHKVVLAAAIPYLVEALQNATSGTERREIAIEDINPSALENLINYAYTGQIEITTESVESLLYGACALHVIRVRDACCDFLAYRLNCENVFEIQQFAFAQDCQNLVEKANKFICKNFEAVSRTEDFLKLPFYVVNQLISREDLKVRSEDEVLRAVLNWAKKSPIEREPYLHDLLDNIRIIYLTQGYYNEVIASEEIVMQVFSRTVIQQRTLSLPVGEKLKLYPGIRPRASLISADEYINVAVYLLFTVIVLPILLTTGCFLWFIGCFATLAFDNHFRLVSRLAEILPERNLVKYIIVLFLIVLLVKSPYKCGILLLTKTIVDVFFKKNELYSKS